MEPSVLQALIGEALAALERGAAAEALGPLRTALRSDDTVEPLWNLAGLCAATLGDLAEAEQCWRRALVLRPSADTTLRLGGRLVQTGRMAEALLCWRHMAAAGISDPRLLAAEQSVVSSLQGDDAAVERCWWQAVAEVSGPRAFVQFGIALYRGQRLALAESATRTALALLPGDAAALTNLGVILEGQRRFDEAETVQRAALRAAPDTPEILCHLADLVAARGDEAEAERLYRQALAVQPSFDVAHANLGVLQFDSSRLADAERSFRAALAIRPDSASATMNLGQLLLADGRLAEGWSLCDVSYARDAPKVLPGFPADTGTCRRWQGEPLAGRALLVWADQGYGDQLQFCRYVALLRSLGAERLTLVCAPPLQRLFARTLDIDHVVPLAGDSGALVQQHSAWVPLLGLPLRFGTTQGTIPAPSRYLWPDPSRVAHWAGRLPPRHGTRHRVGLVWRGNPLHDNDRDRSMAGVAALSPLWSVPGVAFVSLQKGAGEDEAAAPPPGQPLTALGSDCADFDDTAAVVAQLDLVITVDSAVAHLAGALGVPCWVLLPARRCDWRWQLGRSDTPWYPATRLFRQPRRGDWATPVAAMAAALARRLSAA